MIVVKCKNCTQKLNVTNAPDDCIMHCPRCGYDESIKDAHSRSVDDIYDVLMDATSPDELSKIRRGEKSNDELFQEVLRKLQGLK